MEAATLTLSSTLQIDPLRLFICTGHKPTITINPRNRTMTFHQPTSFPHGHLLQLRVMCGHKPRHVAHAVRAGETNGDDGKRAKGMVGPTVVLACVLGTMCLTLPMYRPSPAIAWPWSTQEVTRPNPVPIVEALMNLEEASITMTTGDAQERMKDATLLIKPKDASDKPRPKRIDLPDLKGLARESAIIRGDTDAAVRKLKKTYDHLVNINDGKIDNQAYIYGLVLVEMYIYQGEYDNAMTLVETLKSTMPSDAAPILYKAVIHLMSGKERDARVSWDDYKSKKSDGPTPKKSDDPTAPAASFENFKEKILMSRKLQ